MLTNLKLSLQVPFEIQVIVSPIHFCFGKYKAKNLKAIDVT